MKVAFYHGTRSGLMGLGNWLIRLRLRGRMSHVELVFEPGDHVDDFMPDQDARPTAEGAYWCVSSTGLERLPAWSPRRAGHRGGVRFKRVVLDPKKWIIVRLPADAGRSYDAARWAAKAQGLLYDWQLTLGFLAWLIPQKASRVLCHEAVAGAIGYPEAWRLDPCTLFVVLSKEAE